MIIAQAGRITGVVSVIYKSGGRMLIITRKKFI
jgi:hypothetical protein